MLELSTAGVTLKYCTETTAGTRPTTGYTPVNGIKSIPDLNPEPSTYEVTDLSDTEYKRYIKGLRDVGGALAFTANHTAAFHTAWDALVSAAKTAAGSGKACWFEVNVPNLKSFYFAGTPEALGLGAVDVDSVLEIDAYITPNKVDGWDDAST